MTVDGIGTLTIRCLISRSLSGLNVRRDRGVVVGVVGVVAGVVGVVAGSDVHRVARRRGGSRGLDGRCRCWCRDNRDGS